MIYMKESHNHKLQHFNVKKENPFIFNDLNISYENFPWETYLEINDDLKDTGINTYLSAWNHWKKYGKMEERAFSYINNTNIHNARFGNIFFINMFLSILSMKYNIKCSYKYEKKFKKLGIFFHKGKNIYNKNILVTENNFIYLLRETLIPSNIIITNEVYFQTKEFCQILHRYFNVDKLKNRIIKSNIYSARYKNNDDLFIHVRLGDIKQLMVDNYDKLDKLISKITYREAFISSDSIEDPFCKKLIIKYNLRVYISSDIETIMFANTCNKIIMSGGTFSWMLGFFGFFSEKIFYLKLPKTWYGDIFFFDNWISNDLLEASDKDVSTEFSKTFTDNFYEYVFEKEKIDKIEKIDNILEKYKKY